MTEATVIAKKVLVRPEPLERIREDIKLWAGKGKETGGYVVGHIHENLVYEVTDVIEGGPHAQRSSCSFHPDNRYAQDMLTDLKEVDESLYLLQEYHLHLSALSSRPSAGDVTQLIQLKKERPWYQIMLFNARGDFKIFDLDVNNEIIEIPHQILPTNIAINEGEILNRILRITDNQQLGRKTVAILGLGSGGSRIAVDLGMTGIGKIILVDHEELELPNIIRHEGGLPDIGKNKTEISKRIIENHNPFTVVETYDIDATNEIETIEGIIKRSDLIIGATGSAQVNNIINQIARENGKTVVYGGVFRKAEGGYVFISTSDGPCFNCLFDITSQAFHPNREEISRYGVSEDDLHAEQGLYMDISVISLLTAKVALNILEDKTDFLSDYNFIHYSSKNFEVTKLVMKRREDCVVCNFDNWLNEQ